MAIDLSNLLRSKAAPSLGTFNETVSPKAPEPSTPTLPTQPGPSDAITAKIQELSQTQQPDTPPAFDLTASMSSGQGPVAPRPLSVPSAGEFSGVQEANKFGQGLTEQGYRDTSSISEPTQQESESSMIPTASAAEPENKDILQSFLDDESQDYESRKTVFESLQNGDDPEGIKEYLKQQGYTPKTVAAPTVPKTEEPTTIFGKLVDSFASSGKQLAGLAAKTYRAAEAGGEDIVNAAKGGFTGVSKDGKPYDKDEAVVDGIRGLLRIGFSPMEGAIGQNMEEGKKVWNDIPKTYQDSIVRSMRTSLPIGTEDAISYLKNQYEMLPEDAKHEANKFFKGVDLGAQLLGAGNAEGTVKKAGEKIIEPLATSAEKAGSAVSSTTKAVKEGIANAPEAAIKAVKSTETLVNDAKKAANTVVQGAPEDAKAALNTLASIDTTGVKTYKELSERIGDEIKGLSETLDESAGKLGELVGPKDTVISVRNAAGRKISKNPVSDALDHLNELYTKTGDIEGQARISDYIDKFKAGKMPVSDINKIAKEYGSEFKSKAFTKVGEPSTSVTGQAFEQTRNDIKTVFRDKMPEGAPKIIDKRISELINTKNLVDDMADKAFKLQQKLKDRGLLERFGGFVSNLADFSTGHMLRGAVSKLIPSNEGFKVMNSIELQNALEKNLKIIRRASDSVDAGDIAGAKKALSEIQMKQLPAPSVPEKTIPIPTIAPK